LPTIPTRVESIRGRQVGARKYRKPPPRFAKTKKPYRRGNTRRFDRPSFFDPLPDDIIAAFENRLNPEEDP
jgi:hypothetical protein